MNAIIKILILEDVAADAELEALELTDAGFAISSKRVETRDAFIQELEEFKPDIILADYSLPDFDGMAALDIVLEKKLTIPFIFVSGSLGEERAVEAVKRGATDYVLKQNLLRLVPSVRRALHEAEEKKKRKKIEGSLRESEERYRTILESIEEGYYEVDLAGNLTFFNDSLCSIFGYSRDELLGVNNRNYMDPETSKNIYRIFNAVYHTGQPGKIFDWEFIKKDGAKIYVEISISLVKNSKGERAGFRGILRDITERKLHEERIQAALEERTVLLREIHHRVKHNNQIISSLLGLQAYSIDDPKITELFQESQNRIKSMALIHEKLYRSENFSNINFNNYIQDIVTLLSQTYSVDLNTIQIQIDAHDPDLRLDTAIPCGLIINELVSNSLKYAFKGRSKGLLHVGLNRDDNNLYTLTVRDDGIGIPSDLDPENSSTLGLKIVSTLVNQLNGTITTGTGRGAEFVIRFSDKPAARGFA